MTVQHSAALAASHINEETMNPPTHLEPLTHTSTCPAGHTAIVVRLLISRAGAAALPCPLATFLLPLLPLPFR